MATMFRGRCCAGGCHVFSPCTRRRSSRKEMMTDARDAASRVGLDGLVESEMRMSSKRKREKRIGWTGSLGHWVLFGSD